jgi:hypothetical protein
MDLSLNEQIFKSEYLTPELLWNSLDINSFEQFLEKIAVKGRFHKDVPQDVIQEFKTIEFLIAYSYFYYPMLDIAFFKATTVFEMAVRLRCEQLKLKIPSVKHISLDHLLKRLSAVVHPSLPREWFVVKVIRNHLAHPNQSSLLGVTTLNGFPQIVNILNKLFLPIDFFNDLETKTNQLIEKSKLFNSGLFVLEYDNKNYLIHCAKPYVNYIRNNKEISFWGCNPVLSEFPKTFKDLTDSYVICLPLTDIEIENGVISATILNKHHKIKIYETENSLNEETYIKFNIQAQMAEPGVFEMYKQFIDEEVSKGIVKFMYEEFWI